MPQILDMPPPLGKMTMYLLIRKSQMKLDFSAPKHEEQRTVHAGTRHLQNGASVQVAEHKRHTQVSDREHSTTEGSGTISDKNGTQYKIKYAPYSTNSENPKTEFVVTDSDGNHVGAAVYVPAKNRNMHISIANDYRRKGIASALYNFIEKTNGKPLNRNPANTEDGEAFWNEREKPKPDPRVAQADKEYAEWQAKQKPEPTPETRSKEESIAVLKKVATSIMGDASPEYFHRAANEVERLLAAHPMLARDYDRRKLDVLDLQDAKRLHGYAEAGGRYNKEFGNNRIEMPVLAATAQSPSLTPGKQNVGKDFETYLRHELAHDLYTSGATIKRSEEAFKARDPRKVSLYAAENPTEYFCECFAAYTSPLYKNKPFLTAAEEYMVSAVVNGFEYPQEVKKSIQHLPSLIKAKPLDGRIDFNGLQISIETGRSRCREWHNEHDGSQGMSRMQLPYGYIKGTMGTDGDHVDVFAGPDREAASVYVVHTVKAPDFTEYDEDKCIVGVSSPEEAVRIFHASYSEPRFFGSMSIWPFEEFKEAVYQMKGKKLENGNKYVTEDSLA